MQNIFIIDYIFYIFSPKDIANLKNEIEKRQKDGESASVVENQEAIEKIIQSQAPQQQSQNTEQAVETS